VYTHRWEEGDKENPEYPPLDYILKTPFWAEDQYAPYRLKLARPVIVPVINSSGNFHTLTNKGESTESGDESTQVNQEALGVLHYMSFDKKSPIPAPLKALGPRIVFLENVGPSYVENANPYIAMLLHQRVPVIMYGEGPTNFEVLSELRSAMAGLADLQVTEVQMMTKTVQVQGKYTHDVMSLSIITRADLQFKVCFPVLVVPASASLVVGLGPLSLMFKLPWIVAALDNHNGFPSCSVLWPPPLRCPASSPTRRTG
jgi:hypothetical protein